MASFGEVYSRLDDLFNIKDYEKWDKEVLRKEVLSRLHNLKVRKMKAWFPTTTVKYDDPKEVCCDKFGGSYPYFSKYDQGWPKCQKCSALMKFMFQVSDPSDLNMFGTIQVFLCPKDYHFTMSDGVDHGFFIRKIDYTEPYQYIPQPASVKAYKGLKITSWQPTWQSYLTGDELYYTICDDCKVISYLGLDKEAAQLTMYAEELEDSEEIESGMKWFGTIWGCQERIRYSRFSFQCKGTIGDIVYSDYGILRAVYKGEELAVVSQK